MDDHGLDNKMSNLNMQDPMQPTPRPIARTDTDTKEVELFVDAEDQ